MPSPNKTTFTQSLNRTASWVIVDLSNGSPIFETFSETVAGKINPARYKAVPIPAWLQSLNAKH